MAVRRQVKWAGCLGMLLVLLLSMPGCSTLGENTISDSGSGGASPEAGPSPQYYDFGDILVPSELERDKEDSFVLSMPGMAAGVLVLKGNVDIDSLITFFNTNMAKDNWQQVTYFKSPRTIMLFKKDNRWCVINITDSDFSTSVEIWVAPAMSGEMGADGGLMK